MNKAEIEIAVLQEAKEKIQAIYDYHKEKKIGATKYENNGLTVHLFANALIGLELAIDEIDKIIDEKQND
jgi:hypothetical protein